MNFDLNGFYDIFRIGLTWSGSDDRLLLPQKLG